MYKVNVALKLTPTQVQYAIDRAQSGVQLLLRLRGVNTGNEGPPQFSATELGLLLDFLPDDALDLDAEETKAEIVHVRDES